MSGENRWGGAGHGVNMYDVVKDYSSSEDTHWGSGKEVPSNGGWINQETNMRMRMEKISKSISAT